MCNKICSWFKVTESFSYVFLLQISMVMKFPWDYRRAHPAEFPFLCKICGPDERRFKREEDQQQHDKMTKRHDPNFVSGQGPRKRRRRKAKDKSIIDSTVLSNVNYRNEYKPVARSLGDTCILRNNVSPNDVSPMYRHIYGPAQVQTHTMPSKSGSINSIWNEHDLGMFIRDHVETDDAYRSVCKSVISNVGDILKNNITGKYRPDEVLKTGSTAKGTAIKGKSDVDLVFLLSRTAYEDIDNFYNDLPTILGDINDALTMFPQFKNVRVQQRAVSFKIDCREPGTGHAHVIDVDLLPAVNFGVHDIRIIHSKMRRTSEAKRNLFTPSLTKWQRDFIKKDRTEQLKKLIRFVKYWKNENVQRSPSSFALELLIIYLWNQEDDPRQFQHAAPYIIDPVNPYSNEAAKCRWDEISREANQFLQKPLMRSATSKFI
ncbi:OAS [Mytilus edulis]|uniref:OAS n=1 Tax=Mytilus edulis TaxID=6550 RepID=A0A8S3SF74_MYTED|nr:OAS [Mytilus edulis]